VQYKTMHKVTLHKTQRRRIKAGGSEAITVQVTLQVTLRQPERLSCNAREAAGRAGPTGADGASAAPREQE
jgi:hypothetical protein